MSEAKSTMGPAGLEIESCTGSEHMTPRMPGSPRVHRIRLSGNKDKILWRGIIIMPFLFHISTS
jgi:hypothetical protein